MKIRTQLVVALFLLAIVPLAAIVLFTYATSLRAVRSAVEEESRALTEEMDGRMDSIRTDLMASFARLGEFPFRSLSGDQVAGADGADPLLDELVLTMGDTARLVHSLEFVPSPPVPADRPPVELAAAPEPPERPERGLAELPEWPAGASVGEVSVHLSEAVVIDVPRILDDLREAKRTMAEGKVSEGAAVGLAVEVLGGIAADLAEQTVELRARIERYEAAGVGIADQELHEMEAALEAQEKARVAVTVQLHEAIAARRRLSDEERATLAERRKEQQLLFGQEFQVAVEEKGKVVGHLTACVEGKDLVADVLARSAREAGEIPFAIDREGTLYAGSDEDRALLDKLGLERIADGWLLGESATDEWVLATSEDMGSGLTFGVVRPIRRSLTQVRKTAARNFGVGLGLVVVGLLGIQPLSRKMTHQLEVVTSGAERIARGDLQTRVPVRSKSEFGQLAEAFNRMAADLSKHHERELSRRLLEAEYLRKTEELEQARRFQLSLLPSCLPRVNGLELAAAMTTATEVGGDFYDFYTPQDGVLTLAVGDATGHGARAGTMVTVVKSLLTADAGHSDPADFLRSANRAIRRMQLERMTMALCMARFEGHTLTIASAAMPPVLVHRAVTGEVEELTFCGMPLGGLDDAFPERTLDVLPGDTVLLMSDGFPELPAPSGDPLGYAEARDRFARVADRTPEEIIAALQQDACRWAETDLPHDDLTFVVLRGRST